MLLRAGSAAGGWSGGGLLWGIGTRYVVLAGPGVCPLWTAPRSLGYGLLDTAAPLPEL